MSQPPQHGRERKVFWLSFSDADRPTGTQFLGAAVIDVTADEADAAASILRERFPVARPQSEWIAAALTKAHRLGCNPGGEVMTMEIDPAHPNLSRFDLGVLMDRATIERLDGVAAQDIRP